MSNLAVGLALAALITVCFYPRILRASHDRVDVFFFTAGIYLAAVLAEVLLVGLVCLIGIALGLS